MEDIKLYDFKKSEKFSIENIRYLMLMSEEFCKTSNMQIGYETKSENFKFVVDKSRQKTYSEFIEELDNDNVVIEYNVNPLVENLTLFINKNIVLTIVDLLLGGDGKVDNKERELTNIDLELFKYLADSLLKRLYIPYKYDSINLIKIYTSAVKYQRLKNKDIVFESKINALLGTEKLGDIRFCIPYQSMEPVVGDLVNSYKYRNVNPASDDDKNIFSKEVFDSVKNVYIDVYAKLGSAKVNINDLVNLEKGDVILLDQRIGEDIKINLGDAGIYKGKPGLLGLKKAVEITDIIDGER